ncbi:hypothetical protein ALC62_01883 [Cyphomyrmex costatus]|uniref:Uncharacterized protein n=1 Tax=Cyphomyrmex costatus TaxID=456900 RepID=A0A151INX2_9HYME|nr:hypothetical protein ALC62_09909 [Cyphomyrmex costatus]KYN07151.1 hypothetical protein ALC62_01883 [Cyphomyrmex costatus]
MIQVAKTTATENGILEGPNPKSHPALQENVANAIVTFYQSDEFSRVMPGQKDYVSVKVDGTRHHIQKRLVLNNLKELYNEFKERNPELLCSFSKFAALRPKQCILAGASGTHSVCVCCIHENVKLLIDGVNFKRLTADFLEPIKTYHECLNKIICNPPSTDCYMGTCPACPGTNDLIQQLQTIFDGNYIDTITYKQWTHVDRTTLQTVVSTVDEFLQVLADGLNKLLRHSYIVKKQNEFLNSKKENLKSNECIAIVDFSENYSFVVQNAIQGIHWNNDQATVHPTAIYYKNEQNELKMKSLVSISECLKHDTIAVHLFQSKIVEFIKQNLPKITKIIYFSDGASAQYKNRKNFINLSHHKADFGIAAEWHFFPTSHGKGPSDGIGGTLKRLAARASLQRIDNPIQTPTELFLWATKALPNIHCNYFTIDQYNQDEAKLTPRFQLAKTVKGTLQYHCVIPATLSTLHVKPFSNFEKVTVIKIMK